MIDVADIQRLWLGWFVMPEDSSHPRHRIVICAYVIRHPGGTVLFDTGLGEGHEESEALYTPVRRPFREELARTGLEPRDVRAVANCHFHVDHCGHNPLFPRTPIFAQRRQYEAAHEDVGDYHLPVIDFEGAAYELHDGEADILPGLRIVPTPGHVPGHQSLLVRTRQGNVVLAGQAMNLASDYGRAHFAWHVEGPDGLAGAGFPDWVGRLQEFDPVRVYFAHDLTVWTRPELP